MITNCKCMIRIYHRLYLQYYCILILFLSLCFIMTCTLCTLCTSQYQMKPVLVTKQEKQIIIRKTKLLLNIRITNMRKFDIVEISCMVLAVSIYKSVHYIRDYSSASYLCMESNDISICYNTRTSSISDLKSLSQRARRL